MSTNESGRGAAGADAQEDPAAVRSAIHPVRAVVSLIRFRPWLFAVTAIAWLLFHAWPLIPGLLGKAFFDLMTGSAPLGLSLGAVLALVAAAGLGRIGIIVGGTFAGTRWRVIARSLLQRNMLDRVLHLPGARALPSGVGASLSTFRDDAHAISMMGDWVYDSVAAAVFIAGGVAILLSVDPWVTVLVVPPIVAVVAIAHSARNRFERFREQSRAATADVTKSIGDLVAAVRTIQASGKEASVVAHVRRLGDERKRATLRDDLHAAWLDAAFAYTANLGAGLTLLVAAGAMRAGSFTIGDFVLFSTYLFQVTHYTRFIGYLARTRRQAHVAVRRAADLMQGAPQSKLVARHTLALNTRGPAVPTQMSSPERMPLQELRVVDLTLAFPASGRGIRGVNLVVNRGTVTVITGRIGAGKTTLLRAILGLLPADSGQLFWNGVEVREPAQFLVPPRTAYLPQSPSLLSGTLRENILLGWPANDAVLERAVHTAALDRDVADLPDGLGTEIGVRGTRLSGGQVQRTAAARMLVRQADLILVDDLSSSVDVETELDLWRRLAGSETTCIAVSHRRVALERADQIIVLKDGDVVGTGTLEDLLRTCPELRLLYSATDGEA